MDIHTLWTKLVAKSVEGEEFTKNALISSVMQNGKLTAKQPKEDLKEQQLTELFLAYNVS